ncbi:MAG: DNA gyrase inhibitor YacG [Bryobacterales bacterium]|nr:DNA gyrase inhibitor YacG [Bryobacterales bacterium]
MKCPICKKPVAFGEPYMPFCSERCKLVDLGNWLDERYVISTPLAPDEVIERGGGEGDGTENGSA